MASLVSSISSVEARRSNELKLPSWSKKTLFMKAKPSDEWHTQIDFTAGQFRPSDHKFPWTLIRKHTDYYLKKKGKLSQTEIDVKLAALIESHEARDVAIASCAHAMSPAAVRALLNVELNVAPATFFGLGKYLSSLIAANVCSPKAVSALEAQWAQRIIPYAIHGSGAAGRYLEGLCVILRTTNTPNLNALPDFAILARRAFKTFATQLEGMKLRGQWLIAHAAVAWMSALAQIMPTVAPPGQFLPEHLLDLQFPIWRIYAAWRPNVQRLIMFNCMDSCRRGVLPDLMALEGPDFINGTHATLRDGLVAQYGAAKPFIQFRSLILELPECSKEALGNILDRTAQILEIAVNGRDGTFDLFTQLAIASPITTESLDIIEAASKIRDTPTFHVHKAIQTIYLEKHNIGGMHIAALQHLICALDDSEGDTLRKVMLKPWLVQGIEKCFTECQQAIRTHIDSSLAWPHLMSEFHTFSTILKGSNNCLGLLNETIRNQLDILPSGDLLRTVLDILGEVEAKDSSETSSGTNSLKTSIEAWCVDKMLERGSMNLSSQRTVDAIVKVWNKSTTTNEDLQRRSLAIIASRMVSLDFVLRCRCFHNIMSLDGQLVNDILRILEGYRKQPESNCIIFTKLLANTNVLDTAQCWKNILFEMIENLQPMAIIDYSLNNFKTYEWSQFMLDLNTLFADIIMNPKASPPFVLQSHLHLWVQELYNYLPAITRLEETLGDHSLALQVICKGGEGLWVEGLVDILNTLTQASEQPVERLMHQIVAKLSTEGKNAPDIAASIKALLSATLEGLAACERIFDAKRNVANVSGLETQPVPASPKSHEITRKPVKKTVSDDTKEEENIPDAILEVIVAGWLQDEDILDSDKEAIKTLASLLNLEIYIYGIPKDKLTEATNYFAEQEAKLIEEAERLQDVQRALKARDPKGTAILLAQLGIDDMSLLDEEIEGLPMAIAGAVEKHGDNEIEISFPLASYTDLQRSAMGLGTAKTLLVRFFLDYMGDMPPSFCVHLDIEALDYNVNHTPWVCLSDSKSPDQPYCAQTSTPFSWQLSRLLHSYLQNSQGAGIADLHDYIKHRMEVLAHLCNVCGQAHNPRNTNLRRSMPCSRTSCARIWNDAPLDIRIPEIRTDTFAVDMILTTVYAAAMSCRTELLPGCPIANTATIQAILNSLPSLATLKASPNLSATLSFYHQDAEKLLVWALTHFRGFVATASGICKVPGMPVGTHQFLLANASPKLEADFAARLPRNNPATKVLFHGTSLDRLPNILAQGLRIHSGTSLQRTGAAHGKGIYLAEEPATSFSYSPSAVSWRNSGLNSMRLLLGCEVVGSGRSVSAGIHVITDEKSVMVRYVFLLNNSAYAPNATHVVPAMGSAMNALRSGAV